MKQARKEELMRRFPPITDKHRSIMEGRKNAENFAVFLRSDLDDSLFVRCYHRYYSGIIAERQRYVFAKDGAVRYGINRDGNWHICKEFKEPVFVNNYGRYLDNTYKVIDPNVYKKTAMRYSAFDKYCGNMPIEYLRFYVRHPNVEYIVKQGFDIFTEEYGSFYGNFPTRLRCSADIDWKSNNLLKMLRLSREEFKLLKGSEKKYEVYIKWREKYPKYAPRELLDFAKVFGYEFGTFEKMRDNSAKSMTRTVHYLADHGIDLRDYNDYLDQCKRLNYDLNDTAIAFPKDFDAMHGRLSTIIKYNADKKARESFVSLYEGRKRLCFSAMGFAVIQPESPEDITCEGRALNHCVGGYAERHSYGKLHILFIRRVDAMDIPLYTMEVSVSGRIVQVRGLRNCAPDKDGQAFVELYRNYLKTVFTGEERKTA